MLSNYLDPDRHYHGMAHIADLLRELPNVVAEFGSRIKYLEALINAIIRHDMIYVPGLTNNEEMSSIMTPGPMPDREIFHRCCMATRHTGEPLELLEEQIIADMDLMGLSKDWVDFWEDTCNIRAEYIKYTDQEWSAGRIAWARGMLARPRIYYTDYYFWKCEEAARRNLNEMIEVMSQ